MSDENCTNSINIKNDFIINFYKRIYKNNMSDENI